MYVGVGAALDATWIECSVLVVVVVVVVVKGSRRSSNEIQAKWAWQACPHDDPLVLLRGQKCQRRYLRGRGRYHSRASSAPT